MSVQRYHAASGAGTLPVALPDFPLLLQFLHNYDRIS